MSAGLLSLLVAETTALGLLVLISLLVYRAFPQRYLLWWNGAWLIYLAHVVVAVYPHQASGLLAATLLLASQAVMAGSVGLAIGRRAPFRLLLPPAVAAFLADALARQAYPRASGWPCTAGYLLLGLIAAAWVLQYGRRRLGLGPSLLAVALLLRLVHLPEYYPGRLAIYLPEAASSVLAMVSMLVLALESTRQHLRWSAAPGLIASVAADCAAPGRLGLEALDRIAAEIKCVFEPAYSGLYLLPPAGGTPQPEADFLLAALPRSGSGESLCTTVLGFEKGPEAEKWLSERGLRWAVVVPLPHFGLSEGRLAGLFVLGYRARRWISPETMRALMITGRQLGIVLENSALLQQLSGAYRDWLNTMDAIGDFILVHDAEYRIQRVNRALAERVGRTPVEMIQRPCREMLPRAPASPWNDCPFCELPRDGDSFDANFHGYFLVSTSRYPREDPSGILHVVKDITDRKQAEEKYRTMFEKVHEGVFISGRSGRLLDFNEAFARMLGYQRDQLMAADTGALYISREERARYLQLIDSDGYVSDFEVRLRRKNGEEMIGLETSFGIRDESGQVVQFQGFMLDITARKRAEDEVHRHVAILSATNAISERLTGTLDAEELIRIVVSELGPVFSFDTVGGYLLDPATEIARRVAAYGFASDIGQQGLSMPISEELLSAVQEDRRAVIPLADLPSIPEAARLIQAAEALRSIFVLPLRREQTTGAIVVSWRQERALTAAEANLLSAVGRQLNAALENAALYQETRRAYEELRRAQEQLVQSEKMAAVGQLVSGVAHELNNPLTAIIGYAQLLASLVEGKPADYVEKLLHQARRTQKIIQNLLSFSRQSKPQRQPVDVNRVIEDTLVLREFDLRRANIQVERQLGEGLPAANGDLHQLEQVFLNIINNAYDELQAQGSGGTIWVSSFPDGRHVVAEFADSGAGMKEPARVFDPFYTTKPVGQGTGLGLSICYGIIKEHGGEITAVNDPVRGAVFRVRLPIASAAAGAVTSDK